MGEWRVEISPADSRLDDTFLNVISITDGGNEYRRAHAEYVSTRNLDGVIIRNDHGKEATLVLFNKNKAELKDETIQSVGLRKMLIAGLKERTKYSITYKEGSLSIKESFDGNYASSDQGTIYTSFSVM